MTQLTPARYWRIARSLTELQVYPPEQLYWPECIFSQKKPPSAGDGVLLADYDDDAQSGLIRYFGIVSESRGETAHVRWVPTELEMWVDTPTGRGFWKNKAGFAFAREKVPGYGLHEMFARHFDGLSTREELPSVRQAAPVGRQSQRLSIAPERLHPIEIIGESNDSPLGGYVYVLESAYGYKVGRTRNIPNRMRAFGVKLPIAYTIRLCAWFDNHYEAETTYHRLFEDQRINGEWFALQEDDIALIHGRTYAT